MKTIVALFDTLDDAQATRGELVTAGIGQADIEVVEHSGYGAGEGHGGVMPELMGWGVPHDEAVAYAEGLLQGGALLAISPLGDNAMEQALRVLKRGEGAERISVNAAPLAH